MEDNSQGASKQVDLRYTTNICTDNECLDRIPRKCKIIYEYFNPVKERIFKDVATRLKGFDVSKIKVIKEIAYEGGFDCVYEIIIEGEQYRIKVWGDDDYFLYSLYHLLESKSFDFKS